MNGTSYDNIESFDKQEAVWSDLEDIEEDSDSQVIEPKSIPELQLPAPALPVLTSVQE